MTYRLLLFVHNLTRWLILAAAVWSLVRAYSGWLGKRPWASADRRAGQFFSIAMDVQLLLGLLLAVISPLVRAALADMGAAMRVDDLRYFVVEHMPLMLVALVIVHLTSSLVKRASPDAAKHRRAALGYTLVVLALALAIPWFRPLLRGLG